VASGISNSLDCNSIGDLAAAIYQCAKGPGEAEELIVSGLSLSELAESFKIKLAEAAKSQDFTLILSPYCHFEM